MNREDLSIKIAIPLGPRVLCDQNSKFEPIGLTGVILVNRLFMRLAYIYKIIDIRVLLCMN